MSDQVKQRRGIGCCQLKKTNGSLFLLFFIIALLFLVPFAVVDLIFVWRIGIDECYDAVWPNQRLYMQDISMYAEQTRGKFYDFSSMSLREWMYDDGYIKLFMAGMALYLSLLRIQAYEHRRLLLSAFGILFQLYWLFELGWLVSAAVKFWKHTDRNLCDKKVEIYMWVRLIAGFTYALVGLIIYSFRSRDRDYFHSFHPKHLHHPHDNVLVVPPTQRQMQDT